MTAAERSRVLTILQVSQVVYRSYSSLDNEEYDAEESPECSKQPNYLSQSGRVPRAVKFGMNMENTWIPKQGANSCGIDQYQPHTL